MRPEDIDLEFVILSLVQLFSTIYAVPDCSKNQISIVDWSIMHHKLFLIIIFFLPDCFQCSDKSFSAYHFNKPPSQ